MFVLDGSELSFVYLFGFIVSLWFKRLLVAPAAFLVLQSVLMFPLYFSSSRESEGVLFHITHGVTVWAGSITGVFLSHLTRAPKLIRRRSVDRKHTLFHAALVSILALTPWTYIVARDFLQPQFSFIPGVTITLVVYAVAWRAWMRPPMFDYFPCARKMRRFVAAVCGLHLSVLLAFAGIDALFQRIDDACGNYGFTLRITVVTLCTLAVSMARLMEWRRSPAQAENTLRQHYMLQWNDIMETSFSSSSEEEFVDVDL